MENCGIYSIVNKINGKLYIGSSVNLKKRKWEHFNYPKKSSKLLHNSFAKYGKENFEFIILENCAKEDLYKIEQIWIDKTECFIRDKGYNLSKIAEGSREGCTPETAKKVVQIKIEKGFNKQTYPLLSISKIGDKNPMYGKTGSNNPTSRKVASYTLEDVLIKEFNSLREAADFHNIKEVTCISRVASGKRNKVHNLKFKYL